MRDVCRLPRELRAWLPGTVDCPQQLHGRLPVLSAAPGVEYVGVDPRDPWQWPSSAELRERRPSLCRRGGAAVLHPASDTGLYRRRDGRALASWYLREGADHPRRRL